SWSHPPESSVRADIDTAPIIDSVIAHHCGDDGSAIRTVRYVFNIIGGQISDVRPMCAGVICLPQPTGLMCCDDASWLGRIDSDGLNAPAIDGEIAEGCGKRGRKFAECLRCQSGRE